MITLWLRSKMAVFDPYIEQPDGEHDSGECLDPDDDFHAVELDSGLKSIAAGSSHELFHTCVLVRNG